MSNFLREICPFKKRTPFSGRIYAALAGVLLIPFFAFNIGCGANLTVCISGEFPLEPVFLKHAVEVRVSPKFFKILRIEMKNYPILMTMGMYDIKVP
jgi:hypothetical protein